MNKKIKYYENLGSIISFIKNEYPAKISKNFSDKIMNTIESNSEKYTTFFSLNAITKVASVFVFAIITVYVLQFNENQIESFANCLQKVVRGYDSFLGKKCLYIMGLHASPNLEDDNFHFHVEFYPPLRSDDNPKILAGSESMAGVFIMDVLPEDSAKVLRKHMNT